MAGEPEAHDSTFGASDTGEERTTVPRGRVCEREGEFGVSTGHAKAVAALTNAGADPSILDSELLKAADLLD